MSKRGRSTTAEELLAQLASDEEYVARQIREAERHVQLEVRLREIEEPIVRDLSGVGIEVSSVWDLLETRSGYDQALPVLLTHLERRYPGVILEGIARAMAVPGGRKYLRNLIDLYQVKARLPEADEKGLPKGSLAHGLAIAIAALARADDLDSILSLVKDRSLGASRSALILPIARFRNDRTIDLLRELSSDPALREEALEHLRKISMLKRAESPPNV